MLSFFLSNENLWRRPMNFFHSFFSLFRNTNQSIAIYESKLREKMKMKCRNKRWCCHSWRHFEQCLTHSSRISSVLFSYADTLDRNVRTNEKKREENACSFLIIKQKRVGDDGREKKKRRNGEKKERLLIFFFLLSHACLIITECTFVRTTAYHFELSPLCIRFDIVNMICIRQRFYSASSFFYLEYPRNN